MTDKNAAADEQDEDVSHNTMVSALASCGYRLLCVRHVTSFDALESPRIAQIKITLIVLCLELIRTSK